MAVAAMRTVVAAYLLLGWATHMLVTVLRAAVWLVRRDTSTKRNTNGTAHRGGRFATLRLVLLVTAHPDDECMFFGPTLAALAREQSTTHVRVLCLSRGCKQPVMRARELVASCNVLGASCTVVEHPLLQDDPTVAWPAAAVARAVAAEVHSLDCTPDMIVTFDGHGVSGHLNHMAVAAGCKLFIGLARKDSLATVLPGKTLPTDVRRVRLFALESTNILRKYIGVCDSFATLADHLRAITRAFPTLSVRNAQPLFVMGNQNTSSILFVSGITDYFRCVSAMRKHRTQLVWFRYLFMTFSRYFWLNRLVQVA